MGKSETQEVQLITNELNKFSWPLGRLGEALEVLGRHAKLKLSSSNIVTPTSFSGDEQKSLLHDDIDTWLDWACTELGIEVEPLESPVPEMRSLLQSAAPVIIRHVYDGELFVLLLLKVRGNHAFLITPQRQIERIPINELHHSIVREAHQDVAVEIKQMLERVPKKSHQTVQDYLYTEFTRSSSITGIWMLRSPPAGSFLTQLIDEKLLHGLVVILTISTALYSAEIVSWVLIGKGALGGQFGPGWLMAWALILFTIVFLGALVGWIQGIFSIKFGTLLQHRMLAGSLRMNSDVLRSQGVGQLLGRVVESQSFDSLILTGGLSVLVACIQLLISAWVLAQGAAGNLHIILLLFWVLCTLVVFTIFFYRHRKWTSSRLNLTHQLVENMVGHRTRIVQEGAARRHEKEDQQLDQYLQESKKFDRSIIPLSVGISRGWLVVALLGLAPVFVDTPQSTVKLAISVGGVFLAYRAFGQVASGAAALIQAAVTWQQINILFKTTTQLLETSTAVLPNTSSTKSDQEKADVRKSGKMSSKDEKARVLLRASDLCFKFPNQSKQLIDGCNLTIYEGDKILLEGASGGGKSTLAALLTGLRRQDSGLLLLNGLDRTSWGNNWRLQSTSAPQFHENHILTGTLAFNLLMGRNWPASPFDMADAEIMCNKLGLGDLLRRMPSGLLQMVGESGWQLSHGERSRVYLARALLQNADLVVLDESFAALDPKTMARCIKCALASASSLVVIAHP